jgi:translation elongation factor EF-Ts
MMECKSRADRGRGDFEEANLILASAPRQRRRKAGRATTGLIGRVSADHRTAFWSVNCESAVARTPDFQQLVEPISGSSGW